MASISLGLGALLGVGGSVASSLIGSSAASSAANDQTAEEQQALQIQQQEWQQQQQNQAPFVAAGQSTIGQLLAALSNGTFGPGSLGPAPTAPGAFVAPTLQQAQQTPGYQFTQQQGEQGILRGSAAAGGAVTGGTLKALAQYDTGLADNTYNQIFQNSLSTYGAGLNQYQAALQQYNTNAAAQAQAFNQLSSVAGLGENAAANVGNTGAQAASTIGNTLGSIGASQASGIVGAANALTNGITNATGSVSSALTLPYFLQSLNAGQVSGSAPAGWVSQGGGNYIPPAATYQDPGGAG